MQNHAYDMIYIYICRLSCFILIQCSIQQDHPIVRRQLSFLIPVQSCRGASWSWCCAKRTSCILAKKDQAFPVWIDKVFVHPANMTSTELGIRLSEAWRGIGFSLFFSYWVECVQKAGVSKQCSCSASRDVTRITPQALALNWKFYSDSSRVQYCIMFRDDLLSYLDIVGSYLQQSHHLFKIIMISVTLHPLPVHLVSTNKQTNSAGLGPRGLTAFVWRADMALLLAELVGFETPKWVTCCTAAGCSPLATCASHGWMVKMVDPKDCFTKITGWMWMNKRHISIILN